jgi:Condensation domain
VIEHETVALSPVQQYLWHCHAQGAAQPAVLGALRVSGRLGDERLRAAIAETVTAMDILRTAFTTRRGTICAVTVPDQPPVSTCAAGSDEACAALLRHDRDRPRDPTRDPLVRFHVVRLADDELVLGLVADPLVLDPHSVYLVLGAVLQAYLGRFRAAQYPPHAQTLHLLRQQNQEARQGWWLRRLHRWRSAPADGAPAAGRAPAQTLELRLDERHWARLSAVADRAGNTGWLAVIAMLTWWLHTRVDAARPVVFGCTLDLRELLGLGAVVGPLTDQVAFEVELDRFTELSFRDLVLRVHAGLLDAVVHYVPYGTLAALGEAAGTPPPPRPGVPWDQALHYCRLPPTSASTRGEASLAAYGMSVELFRESDLVPAGTVRAAIEAHLAECGDGMAIVVNFDPAVAARAQVAAMLAGIEAQLDTVANDPTVLVSNL